MGSKSRIAKDMVPIIQKCINDNHIDTYIEPFVGGFNVIDKIVCDKRIGGDYNRYLIALFQHLQSGGELLDSVPRELYSEVRRNYGAGHYDDWYVGNIGFLASYNGRWFDGGYAQAGYEKTQNGKRYRDYYQEAKRNIEAQVPQIRDVEIHCRHYLNTPVDCNSLIYCDPPYAGVKQFANATRFNYDEFWETMRKWSAENFVLISELNAPDDFICVWQKSVSRSIKSTDKSRATERLFTYKFGRYAEYMKGLLHE